MNKKGKIFRSPLFYVGDKFKLLPQILSYFPENIEKFVEPFTGGGSVFLNVLASKYELNDINPNVVDLHKFLSQIGNNQETFFRQIDLTIEKYGLSRSYKEDIIPKSLKNEFKKTYIAKFNNESYKKLRDDYNKSNNIMLLYLLLIYGFNRMLRFNSYGKFNLPVGNVDLNKNVITSLRDYFLVTSRLDLNFNTKDYKDFLSEVDLKKNDFIYLDPPYLLTFSEYNKLWNEKTERELLNILDSINSRGIKFAISNVTHYKGKVNDIFLKWSQKYVINNIKSNYISYHDNSLKIFKEVLVTNYEEK